MTALHELTGQFLELANNEDLPAEAIRDTLEAMEGDIRSKAVSLADWALDMDGNIEKIDAAIERLQDKKKSIAKRKESLIEYLRNNMEATGISKIQCPLFSITLVAGREAVAISDESAIPDDFLNVKTVISPDKTAIAKALKDGKEVAGASLQRGQSSIRIK
jgi:hypothetical protein